MASQPRSPLGETLLAPRLVRLFGREFKGLQLSTEGLKNPREEANPQAKDIPNPPFGNLITLALFREGARLARIYGFSYEGRYYKLPSPQVFLVHGEGIEGVPGIP